MCCVHYQNNVFLCLITKQAEEPIVFQLNPSIGRAQREVWIRGRNFAGSVRVVFGDTEAKVLEIEKVDSL